MVVRGMAWAVRGDCRVVPHALWPSPGLPIRQGGALHPGSVAKLMPVQARRRSLIGVNFLDRDGDAGWLEADRP
jgi:hypothetical protein